MYKLKIVNLILIFVILFTLSATAMSQEKVAEPNSDSNDLSLTIVYDNNPYGKNLETRSLRTVCGNSHLYRLRGRKCRISRYIVRLAVCHRHSSRSCSIRVVDGNRTGKDI